MGRLTMTWPQHQRRECSIDGVPRKLTGQQFLMLTYMLFKPPGTIVTHEEMTDHLWTIHNEPERSRAALLTLCCKLRTHYGIPIRILSGQGFMLERDGLTEIDYYFADRYKYPPPRPGKGFGMCNKYVRPERYYG